MRKQIARISLIVMLAFCSFPIPVLGEEANMQNEVGIEFENDYTPDSSGSDSSTSDTSSSSTSSTTSATSSSRVSGSSSGGGKQVLFPATGEIRGQWMLLTGVGLIIIGGVWLTIYRRKSVNK